MHADSTLFMYAFMFSENWHLKMHAGSLVFSDSRNTLLFSKKKKKKTSKKHV